MVKQMTKVTCYECGRLGHYKSGCLKLKNQNQVIKQGKGKARGNSSVTTFNEGPCHAESSHLENFVKINFLLISRKHKILSRRGIELYHHITIGGGGSVIYVTMGGSGSGSVVLAMAVAHGGTDCVVKDKQEG
nr:hypothetical protein [Tanacetum cinerariifolium]